MLEETKKKAIAFLDISLVFLMQSYRLQLYGWDDSILWINGFLVLQLYEWFYSFD